MPGVGERTNHTREKKMESARKVIFAISKIGSYFPYACNNRDLFP